MEKEEEEEEKEDEEVEEEVGDAKIGGLPLGDHPQPTVRPPAALRSSRSLLPTPRQPAN